MSTILKIISIILKFLILLIALLIIVVIFGVSVSNLSYDNVNIKTLYLKYDKKLILNIKNLTITNEDTHKKQVMDIDITVIKPNDKFIINLNKIKLVNQSILLSSHINLDYDEIKNLIRHENKNVELNNVSFIYDNNISPIKADKMYLNFKDDSLDIKFDKPTMDNIALHDTTVKLEHLSEDTILYLDLNSNSSLNKKVLSLIEYYGLKLPLKQYYGQNKINLKIKIPFDDNPISIDLNATLKNSKISYEGYFLKSELLRIKYKDEKLKIFTPKGETIFMDEKLNLNDFDLKLYEDVLDIEAFIKDKDTNKIYLNSKVDLKAKQSKGKINIIKFIDHKNKIKIFKQELLYGVDFKSKIKASVKSNLKINLEEKNIQLDNLKLKYKDNILKVKTNVQLNNNTFVLNSHINLDHSISYGDLYINNFILKDIINIQEQKIKYKIDFKSKPKVYLTSDIRLKIKNRDVFLDNLKVKFYENILRLNTKTIYKDDSFFLSSYINLDTNTTNGELFILNYDKDNIKIKNQKLKYNINFNSMLDINLKTNIQFKLYDENISLEDTKIDFKNNKIKLYSVVNDDKNNSIVIDNYINLEDNTSYGDINIKHIKYGKYIDINHENIPYSLEYKNKIKLYISKYDLNYESIGKKHSLSIGNLNEILKNIKHIKYNEYEQKSKLKLDSPNDFKNINILINNLNLDINSSKVFDDNKTDENTSMNLPIVDLKLFNSEVIYNETKIQTDFTSVKTNKNIINIRLKPINELNNIHINIIDKNISIVANKLSDKFINNISHKNILKDGAMDINLEGTFSKLKGKIKFYKTTIQDVRVLNNLIAFINTTPAIINPLLALPTLFRLNETGFDFQGYYVKNGYIKFKYDIENEYLNMYSILTKGKMADFNGYANIDIKKETIKSKVDVIFLKDYSKFINHIPLIGYIITGDDGNFVTTVDINGTFKKQDFETHTVKNVTTGLFNMIKRTLTLPFLLFKEEKIKKKEEE